MPFSRGSSQPRDGTPVSFTAGRFFTISVTRGVPPDLPDTLKCHLSVMLFLTPSSPQELCPTPFSGPLITDLIRQVTPVSPPFQAWKRAE